MPTNKRNITYIMPECGIFLVVRHMLKYFKSHLTNLLLLEQTLHLLKADKQTKRSCKQTKKL